MEVTFQGVGESGELDHGGSSLLTACSTELEVAIICYLLFPCAMDTTCVDDTCSDGAWSRGGGGR